MLQVEDTQAGHPSTRSLEDYLKFRIRTIGVFPAFPISECVSPALASGKSALVDMFRYAEGIDIPTHAYWHPSIQEIMRVSAEMVILYA